MMSRTEKCEERILCGLTGHRLVDGVYVRCPCREEDERERILGPMYAPDIFERTDLDSKTSSDIVIEGPLASIRRHVGRILLDMKESGKTWLTMDAYRLIEIFLGEDREFQNQHAAIDPDIFILLLGFADPPNKYLPELLLQTLARRELLRSPTWVILGIDISVVAMKYNTVLYEKLLTFGRVRIK